MQQVWEVNPTIIGVVIVICRVLLLYRYSLSLLFEVVVVLFEGGSCDHKIPTAPLPLRTALPGDYGADTSESDASPGFLWSTPRSAHTEQKHIRQSDANLRGVRGEQERKKMPKKLDEYPTEKYPFVNREAYM